MASGAPGYPLDDLLAAAPVGHLRALAGASATIAELLEGQPLDAGRLAKMILAQAEGRTILADPNVRRWLLVTLPPHKILELADKLEIDDRTPVGVATADLASGSLRESRLFAFFGAASVSDTRASQWPFGASAIVHVSYGLFAHQRDAITRTEEALAGQNRRAILHMPTGSGKTRSAMHLVSRHFLREKSAVVVWLAHSKELLEQAASEFERAWEHLGDRPIKVVRMWGSAVTDLLETGDRFIVAGLAKLHGLYRKDIKLFLKFSDLVSLSVIDEAHQSIAPTYNELLSLLATKKHRAKLLGLTATPGRTWSNISEDERLSEFFNRQKVVLQIEGYDNPVKYLIAEKYLARPDFHTLNIHAGLILSQEDHKQLSQALEIPESILMRLAVDEQRTLAIVRRAEVMMRRHRRTIVFATTVSHAMQIAAILVARGRAAAAVTGVTPQMERDRAIQRFKSADVNPMVLVNFGVLTTGFDAPATSAAIICRPTKSLVLYSQMVGRAVRGVRAGGNVVAEIVTVVDPGLPGFADIAEAFFNWEDVWT